MDAVRKFGLVLSVVSGLAFGFWYLPDHLKSLFVFLLCLVILNLVAAGVVFSFEDGEWSSFFGWFFYLECSFSLSVLAGLLIRICVELITIDILPSLFF